jgi:hypothetical protein
MSVWKDFGTGAVVIDDRYLPILVTTFFGDISLEVATWHGTTHQAMVATQARRAAKAISITDSSHTKAPPAEVRKYWGEQTKNFPAEVKQATLAAIVVIKSPIIRGVMTALSWLNPELRTVEVYDTMELALARAREHLRKDGQVVPPEVTRYELPPDARTALAKWVG